jgi:DNA-binding transcriptional regulator/RsmH inhibitor MraZ
MRAYAGLRTLAKVVVAGNFRVIEIWAPERHALITEAGTNDLAGDDLGGLAPS